MTNPTADIPNLDADIRWREWQARGDANDRRTAARTRYVMLFVAVVLIILFIVQLT